MPMTDIKLDELCMDLAFQAWSEAHGGDDPILHAEELLFQFVNDNEYVTYYAKAHNLCAYACTDNGQAWMQECCVQPRSYDEYATNLAYGEILTRSTNALQILFEDSAIQNGDTQ